MVLGAGLTSRDRAGWQVRLPSPPGHATLPITGASVNMTRDLHVAIVYIPNERINAIWAENGSIVDPTDNTNNNYYYYTLQARALKL